MKLRALVESLVLSFAKELGSNVARTAKIRSAAAADPIAASE